MLKITYLLESTDLWGGTKVVIEQAEALADAGHIITILSKDAGPDWYPLKLPVTQVPYFDTSTVPESDIVIGTFWPTVRAAYESKKGIPIHLCQGYEGGNKELMHLKGEIDSVYAYKIPKLTVSPHLDRFLTERFNAETYYIGQMINRDIFYPLKAPREHYITGPFKILIIGPFDVDVKNIATALQGVVLAKKKLPVPVKLIRASQFPLSLDEQKIMTPDIYHFHVAYASMGEIYTNADLLISMSKEAEGFGLTALEAMACGVPVILSRIPSYLGLDVLRDYALFVEYSDALALSDAISEIYHNETMRKKLIQRGMSVAGNFTKEKMVDRLNSAFNEIIYKNGLSLTGIVR